MMPPRVPITDASGLITREWYRFLAALYADSPSAREMSQTIRTLFVGAVPTTTAALYVAPPNTRARIDAATLSNTSGGSVAVTVFLVKAGGVATANNVVLLAQVSTIATRVCPELVNQSLEAGDAIHAFAGAAGLNLVMSGVEIT